MPAARSPPSRIAASPSPDRMTACTAVPKMLVFSTSGMRSSAFIASTGARRANLEDRPRREDRLQLVHGAERRQPSRLDDGHAVAVLRLVQVVRGDQHGHTCSGQFVYEPPEAAARQRIHAARGLVQKDDRRLVEDGASQGQPLAPSPGQVACQRVLSTAQPGHLQHHLAARGQPIALEPVDSAEERDVLVHRERLVQREALRHVADAPFHALGIAGRRRCRRRSPCPTWAGEARTACGWWWTCPPRCCRGTRRSPRP